MRYLERLKKLRASYLGCGAITLLLLVAQGAFAVQDSPALLAVSPKHAHAASAENQDAQPLHASAKPSQLDLGENGPLVKEFAHLAAKIQEGIQIPAPRTQSKVLSIMPASTSVYLSVPNFGDTIYQANQIFHRELQENSVLNDWWQTKAGLAGMMVEGAIEQFHQFTEYLGDELVVSATVKAKGGSPLIVAEIKKPGLKAFLQQLLDQFGGKNAPVKLLTPQDLLTATAPKSKQFLVLVRSDYLVATDDIAVLRSFNAQINRGAGTFSSTAFGQRLTQAYAGGVGLLLGANLQPLLALRPHGEPQTEAALQQSGFADLQYLVVTGRYSGGASSSNVELTFNGPRHGIAGWLGAPEALGSLDFISTHAVSAGVVVLKNPAQMFDDIKSIVDVANPMASAGLNQMETGLKVNLKEDFLGKLGGQIAFALESMDGDTPAWKSVIQVSDPEGLQKTLKLILTSVNENAPAEKSVTLQEKSEDGLTYWTLGFMAGDKHHEAAYAFVDGYMVAASTPALLQDALKIHRNGTSLAKSEDLRKLMPAEHSGQASMLVVQNTGLMLTSMMKQVAPDIAPLLLSLQGQNPYSVVTAYGEESAIRGSSNSHQFDVMVPLVLAAVAIPNLMRSRTSANEAAAAATVRTLNTSEVTYESTYPKKGFAPDLATLGPGRQGFCEKNGGPTEKNACLLDAKLGSSDCTSGTWCAKGDFQYSIAASCEKELCQDYVAVATPTGSKGGGTNFCSTSDAIVRAKSGPPLTRPVSVTECQTWKPI